MAQKAKKVYRNRLLTIALIVFTIYIIASFFWIQQSIREKNTKLAALQLQIDQQTVENEEIQDLLEKGIGDEYIVKIAREQLDYAFPDERIYRDVIGQ